jgi:hypothetical protein
MIFKCYIAHINTKIQSKTIKLDNILYTWVYSQFTKYLIVIFLKIIDEFTIIMIYLSQFYYFGYPLIKTY